MSGEQGDHKVKFTTFSSLFKVYMEFSAVAQLQNSFCKSTKFFFIC